MFARAEGTPRDLEEAEKLARKIKNLGIKRSG